MKVDSVYKSNCGQKQISDETAANMNLLLLAIYILLVTAAVMPGNDFRSGIPCSTKLRGPALSPLQDSQIGVPRIAAFGNRMRSISSLSLLARVTTEGGLRCC